MVYSYNSKKTTLHVPSIDGCDSFLQSLDINHFPYKTSHHNLLTITLAKTRESQLISLHTFTCKLRATSNEFHMLGLFMLTACNHSMKTFRLYYLPIFYLLHSRLKHTHFTPCVIKTLALSSITRNCVRFQCYESIL